MSNTDNPVGISRRTLVKSTALGGLALAAGGISLPFGVRQVAAAVEHAISPPDERVVWSACTVNCGSRCPLRMHVVNGEIRYVETDNTGGDDYDGLHQVRACLRGRSMRRRVYNPDRLKYPMKRVGKRGEGKFVRISWDEALDTIARGMKRIISDYGNEAIYLNYGTGTLGGTMTRSWPPGKTLLARLMNCCGGYLNHYGDYSSAQIAAGLSYTYGGWADGNSPSDIENSKLVVLFGNNPGETRMSGGGVTYYLEQARAKSQARMIVIDPRYTDTAAGREDEWIPIRPGTDAALAAAIAWVLIAENYVDQPFLDNYCVGYDEKTLPPGAPANGHYKAYILGDGPDGTAKTPAWAAPITGIPEARIIKLAREIGEAKPAFIAQGWGPQRHSNGELACRAIAMLPILTGNVGIHGGNSGAREGSFSLPFERMPTLQNPVETSISMFTWTDAIERGPSMTATADGVRGKEKLDVPIKMIWNYAGNCLINQHSQINRTHEILQDDKKCELIVVIDCHMTASARYADILLPDCTASEQMDFALDASCGNMAYVIFADQAIAPRFECRTIYDITSALAARMGVGEQFTEGRTQEGWLRHLYAQSQRAIPELPDFDTFRKQGIFKLRDPQGHHVAYQAFRENPAANPLDTPSGKIEIYSSALADIAANWQLPEGDVIHPLPVYSPGFEQVSDPLRAQYPLQLTGFHYKSRTHSTYGNVDVLQAACRQQIWINPQDAQTRGINDGDLVRVWNARGEARIEAKVTPRIMPGVVALGEGAWYQPDAEGVDHAGSINVLTTQRPSPLAKGNPSHSNLVQLARV
ncbi:molybdopterin-dependent oxidoreductase [Cronobacter malonaticus]|uniref:Anaerobic dimethyl sulfoxide reductase, A subunit n=3 Tax=Cronobacter TaxID=413496 RepID=V5TZL4_9ENTR|nr:dimethylsulfoxide reductase subunit A [Cronobacter malonaticus]CCJ92726.1 Anaerobic dimethyl sulfoxide reductase chain A [Cronobacter malonaticus 681]AHB70377.1 anaerobic dimethyl sulfoxide reductase, A subunit [Cronobacter malonaticus]ALX78610.1 dimethyl sulfoxide reductase subunit A [Cronobacter malonaticus LMG 23826]EGT4279691.1 dimethyl sulfoxide reductase subunit A [Cronobacter malonaticus]EGT4286788.1 dimethyl sulfoxide reductase subunit A [Cronobacter malonaticus]